MTDRVVTMPQKIARVAPVGSLLKKPREQRRGTVGFRSGRVTDAHYLDLIRELPCLKCGIEPCGEAAHVRMNSASFGKRQAIGQKPGDAWAISLCPDCHRNDPDSQHKIGSEEQFWAALGLNPLLICADLQKVAGDVVAMRAVILSYMAGRRGDQK